MIGRRRLALAVLAGILAVWLRFVPAPQIAQSDLVDLADDTDLTRVPSVVAPPPPAPSSFASIVNRPLFHPSRLPPEPPPPPAYAPPPGPEPEAGAADLSQFMLVGVVINGSDRTAIVRTLSGERLALRVGEALDLWTVVNISPEVITLESDGQVGSLPLDPEP